MSIAVIIQIVHTSIMYMEQTTTNTKFSVQDVMPNIMEMMRSSPINHIIHVVRNVGESVDGLIKMGNGDSTTLNGITTFAINATIAR